MTLTTVFLKRNLSHLSRARLRAYLAAYHGVSEQQLLETISKRKAFQRARMHRRRSRKRALERNPQAKRRMIRPVQYAGEGELHTLVRQAGFTIDEFCRFAGISPRTFHGWYGHPMHRMPITLLEYYIYATRMAQFLRERGWDPEKFKPHGLPTTKEGRYVRTKEQGKELLASLLPKRIQCHRHGWQEAIGGECPRC